MLEARSPLVGAGKTTINDVTLCEAPGFQLTQVAGEDKVLKKALGKLPSVVGKVLETGTHTLFRIGPRQLWVLGDAPLAGAGVYVTPLSSGRTRMLLEGQRARDVLAACTVIDFHLSQFKPGQFMLTGIHHTPVLIHCRAGNSFHIYALRSFARNVWDWLSDVMEGLPYD